MKSLSTDKKIVTTTLGALWAQAKAKGIEMRRDGTYMMNIKNGSLWIDQCGIQQKTTSLTVNELIKLAKASGIKPRKDEKGQEYYTINLDADLKQAWVETPSDKDLKIAKAITPGRG